MCGLAGFLSGRTISGGESDEIVRRMADTLVARGPDDGGLWGDGQHGVALAHRRLAILDLSSAGHQPMISVTGRYVIVFNGEIYNHLELRSDLQRVGAGFSVWRGHSDTETLLAGFEFWGVEATLKKARGMFAIALWDRESRCLTLARDRLGEKPLYYGWQRGVFLFGSELKALMVHPAFQGEIDRDALALYMRHGYIPAPHTIYRGIHKLTQGSFLQLTADKGVAETIAEVKPYWSARESAESGLREPFSGNEIDARDRLDVILGDAISEQMIADVPLGAFLSGGVDSTAVVALMQARSSVPVKTFTIGFREGEYNEAQHAKAVARFLGTEHTELYVTPEQALAVIPKLPSLYDEPFADSSQIPTFLVAQLARQHVTVSLSGDGGDELFGGYNRYLWAAEIWRRLGPVPGALRGMAAAGIQSISPVVWNRVFALARPLVPPRFRYANPGDKLHKAAGVLGAKRPEDIYLRLVSLWHDPASVVLGAGLPATPVTDRDAWLNCSDFEQRMMYLDTVTYLPDDILVKVDRAAMGVSLETRVPLLDHRVVEFAWSLPLSMKMREGQGKWLLRQVLYKHVPKELMERPKMGFGVPIEHWLRGPLREWAESLLSEERLRCEGYFDPGSIRQKWKEYLDGRRNWQYLLWCVLIFQAWKEEWKLGR